MRPARTKSLPKQLRRRRAGWAFSLMEMVVALGVLSIVITATGSAILVAGKAIPDAGGSGARSLDAARAADQIATELHSAASVTQYSATMIELTVERGGVSHTIRYEWSGTAGGPLTRQYDGGAVVNVLEDVQDLAFTYHTKTVAGTTTQTVQSDEILLASFAGWPGIPSPSELGCSVSVDCYAAEFFTISGLPDNVSKLSITRVFLKMRQSTLGDGGTFSVGIHRTVGGGNPEPGPNPLGTPAVGSSSGFGSSFLWREFTFCDVVINSPGKEYAIVVKGSAADPVTYDAEVLRYLDTAAPANDVVALWSINSGGQWDPNKKQRDQSDFLFNVYGVYETTGTVETSSDLLESVGIRVVVGSEPSVQAETEALTLNRPELPGS